MSVAFRKSQRSAAIVPCYQSLNLLAHGQMEELETGSRCGGHGVCGGDRIKILSGRNQLSPVTEAEKEHLSVLEIQEGWRLACQAWPNENDLEISIELPFEQIG